MEHATILRAFGMIYIIRKGPIRLECKEFYFYLVK